jgi:hypothetical protein
MVYGISRQLMEVCMTILPSFTTGGDVISVAEDALVWVVAILRPQSHVSKKREFPLIF